MEERWKLHVMGCRGSWPVWGEEFRQFGGATSCYILKRGSYAIVVDCGTGLYRAGPLLANCDRVDVLLTHIHYDHLMGLLNWGVFPQGARLRFFGQFDRWFGQETLARFMGPPFWPYTPQADQLIQVSSPGEVELDESVTVLFHPSNHPDGASILRINTLNGSLCAAFDYEHTRMFPEEIGKGCNLLLYDAMYTRKEYPEHVGWGHSCWEEGCILAGSLGVGRLLITHHNPQKSDEKLLELELLAQCQRNDTRFVRAGDVFDLERGDLIQ